MQRIAYLGLPAHGHINPSLALVRELREREVEVQYYANELFRERIEQAGADYRSYALATEGFIPPTNLVATAQLLAERSEQLLPRLLSDLQADRPTAIIHDSLAPWGAIAAQQLGVPAICATTTMALTLPVVMNAPRFAAQVLSSLLNAGSALEAYRAVSKRLQRSYGVNYGSPFDLFRNEQPLNLVFTAKEFQPQANRFGAAWQFVGPTLPKIAPQEPLPFERRSDLPLIYISLGTLFNTNLDFYRACIAAFGNQPCQVVISIGRQIQAADLGPLPANIVVQPFVNQLAVLAQCDLFITHGGLNSVHEGLWNGVPLLVIPQAAEQGLVASRVTALKAGIPLWNKNVTATDLRTGAYQLLEKELYRKNSHRLEEALRQAGGANRAADLVLGMTYSPPSLPSRRSIAATS
jgi:MGT family glycosyltransferase